jgi:hypothetical protein
VPVLKALPRYYHSLPISTKQLGIRIFLRPPLLSESMILNRVQTVVFIILCQRATGGVMFVAISQTLPFYDI